jgi:glycine hydroxymethyltransferase
MGPQDMNEIASIMTLVLSNTKAEVTDKGPSKAKYTVGDSAKREARGQVERLLGRYPVYPELDLELIQDFVGHAVGALA